MKKVCWRITFYSASPDGNTSYTNLGAFQTENNISASLYYRLYDFSTSSVGRAELWRMRQLFDAGPLPWLFTIVIQTVSSYMYIYVHIFINARKFEIKIYLHGDYDVWYVQDLLQVAPGLLSTSCWCYASYWCCKFQLFVPFDPRIRARI